MKTHSRQSILWGIGAALFIGVILLMNIGGDGTASNPSAYSASAISTLENSFDFNTISMKDGDVSHRFEMKNDGEESVIIEKVYTSCMCTTAYIIKSSGQKYGKFGMQGHGLTAKTNIEIEPGETAIVEAIFNPAAHGPSGIGLAQRSIYLETNSAESPKVELRFTAMVAR